MPDLWVFICIGFIAQLIDGSIGMAYGVSASSFLLGIGLPPAITSASVHIAEVFTTGVSGASHWKLGNVNWAYATKLIIPGMIGGISGAYFLTSFDGAILRPFIALYLFTMGLFVLWKVMKFKKHHARPVVRHISILALAGGWSDAVGGGGWGPVVTTTLVGRGGNPREIIGSVNFAEFFVTLVQAITFIALLGTLPWNIIGGLLIGGVLAAPLGALIVRTIPARVLMAIVAVIIVTLSVRTMLLSLGYSFLF